MGCALASNGRKTCVLEARPRVTPSKRGLTLQPNGLETLQKLGLLDQVVRIGAKVTRVTWHEIGGGPLATFDYSILNHPHNYLLTVVPSELELVLREVFSNKGGTIHSSTFFREILLTRFGRVIKAERNGSSVEYSAKIVVGADGETSKVRPALRIPAKVKKYPDVFLFTLAGPVASISAEARQYVARGKMVGLFPTRDSTYIFYYLPRRRSEDFKARGLESFKKEIASIEPELSDSLGGLGSWEDITYASPQRVNVKNWVVDRAALLGDAVHALDPSWAQGANMALQMLWLYQTRWRDALSWTISARTRSKARYSVMAWPAGEPQSLRRFAPSRSAGSCRQTRSPAEPSRQSTPARLTYEPRCRSPRP